MTESAILEFLKLIEAPGILALLVVIYLLIRYLSNLTKELSKFGQNIAGLTELLRVLVTGRQNDGPTDQN